MLFGFREEIFLTFCQLTADTVKWPVVELGGFAALRVTGALLIEFEIKFRGDGNDLCVCVLLPNIVLELAAAGRSGNRRL